MRFGSDALGFVVRRACFGLSVYLPVSVALAGEHPQLLIKKADLPRIRHVAGLEAMPGVGADGPGFGEMGESFRRMVAHFEQTAGEMPQSGETAAAAFVHLANPKDARAARCAERVAAQLKQPMGVMTDVLEMVVALDWCWAALPADTRMEFIRNARQRAAAFTLSDSPLDGRVFHEKLGYLALAIVVDDVDETSSAWKSQREGIIAAGSKCFAGPLATFVKWRGLSPTSPSAAAREETSTALALELDSMIGGAEIWEGSRGTVGRWMEHYLFETAAHPNSRRQLLRDDGTNCPETPVAGWEAFYPVAAHLIAARTRDAAAAAVAQRVEGMMGGAGANERVLWGWAPMVLGIRDVPAADVAKLPAARNFGGAVGLRTAATGFGGMETVVWIEAGQPILRRGQHFDAGHFLINAGGNLAIQAAEDVALEATAGKGGAQGLGKSSAAFDFEQFTCSTIAHNCLILNDISQIPRWYAKEYVPRGGQRLVEGTCRDFGEEMNEKNPRWAGKLAAYGVSETMRAEGLGGETIAPVAYAALDIKAAYETRMIGAYTREFVFFDGRALLVIDRMKLTRAGDPPTWILNIPSRPTVDGTDLAAVARVAGENNSGGIWRYGVESGPVAYAGKALPAGEERADGADGGKKGAALPEWIRWEEGEGALWCASLLPGKRRVNIVGGPGEKRTIGAGPFAGRAYVGGAADSFERLVVPSGRNKPQNAWYKLGTPTLLGPDFGRVPVWGRIEIEPGKREQQTIFATLLITSSSKDATPPAVSVQDKAGEIEIVVGTGKRAARILIAAETTVRGGKIEFGEGGVGWGFPNGVEADLPLATR